MKTAELEITELAPKQVSDRRSLVQPMFEGPVDIIGDVHGELEALNALLKVLGYSPTGEHPEGRRLVFLGDLVDRGPDSLGVLTLVKGMIDRGLAQCILGNHEFNLLRRAPKKDNGWFFGESPLADGSILSERQRVEILDFLATLPLALERSDLRAVHACWDDAAIAEAHKADAVMSLYETYRLRIEEELAAAGTADKVEKNLARQNRNPVKLITGGPEGRTETPFEAGGKMRQEVRMPWWKTYADDRFCVFGHYWRGGRIAGDDPFFGDALYELLGRGNAMCIDYCVGSRQAQRAGKDVQHMAALAALRWPELELRFDDGQIVKPCSGEQKFAAATP